MVSRPDFRPGPNALLAFRTTNVRSCWNSVTLSMLPAENSPRPGTLSLRIPGERPPLSALSAAGILGANAAGKSTVLAAMEDFRNLVMQCPRPEAPIREPFRLDSSGPQEPSEFTIYLVLNGIRWQYHLSVDDDMVIAERAHYYPKGRRCLVFTRDRGQKLTFGAKFRASGVSKVPPPAKSSPYLPSVGHATMASSDRTAPIISTLGPLYLWLTGHWVFSHHPSRPDALQQTAVALATKGLHDKIDMLVRAADLGLSGIELDNDNGPRPDQAIRVKRNDAAPPMHRRAVALESTGTRAWIARIGPLVNALECGGVLLVDDLDAGLHPHLAREIVRLFQNQEKNPKGAQLIFTATNPSLLHDPTASVLRHDQVYIAERDPGGRTSLSSVADFKAGPGGEGEDIAKPYMAGRYGGIPVLSFHQIGPD